MREAVPRHFLAIIDLLLDIKKMPTSHQRATNEPPTSHQRVTNESPLKPSMFSHIRNELPRVTINIQKIYIYIFFIYLWQLVVTRCRHRRTYQTPVATRRQLAGNPLATRWQLVGDPLAPASFHVVDNLKKRT